MPSVTLAELKYGIHRKGQPVRLNDALFQVLLRVDVLPWDEQVARRYGSICCQMEILDINLNDFDMMIVAHATEVNATLVSRDKAFNQLLNGSTNDFRLEVW